jgi:hypothetical protein
MYRSENNAILIFLSVKSAIAHLPVHWNSELSKTEQQNVRNCSEFVRNFVIFMDRRILGTKKYNILLVLFTKLGHEI